MKLTPATAIHDVLKEPEEDLLDRTARAIIERMSPPGALGLPPLLEARRVQYGIPDEAFQEHCLYDRIYVWQIHQKYDDDSNNKTFVKGGNILKPETTQKRDVKESTRGIILSAGLKALDCLRSNGADLGHIINFIRLSPWEKTIGYYAETPQSVKVLKAGDLISSEDMPELLKAGVCRVVEEDGVHVFVDQTGKSWIPKLPWQDESF